ncbi:hypothetical protein CCR97_14450 [Rhodoplanes elegans]|uniref:hypothetical protein n=1 Tax=Rhodoplanes elegans TaxID=29408 RepID=UPI001913A41B|nr:hypothetical protein [Rhodoplanes elegans]MBK5959398.1 hypothetical protein [Rhodoplanes elegans]
MRPMTFVACAAAAGLVAVLFSAPEAEAATKRRQAKTYDIVADYNGRPASRVTVRKRSFLDPGREPLPNSQHYSDYALSPSYTVFPHWMDNNAFPGSWSRAPLPGQFDIPGWSRY